MSKTTGSHARSAPVLVLVTGLPCTGKSFLAENIARRYRLPYIHKDGIKERLFDSLGWSDRPWSKRLGSASYAILFYFAEVMMEAGTSFVMESNFDASLHGDIFRSLQNTYHFRCVQIQCIAKGEVLFERYRQRWESGKRHPGHVDPETYAELRSSLLQGRLSPLPLEGLYLELDTTDLSKLDLEGFTESLNGLLDPAQENTAPPIR